MEGGGLSWVEFAGGSDGGLVKVVGGLVVWWIENKGKKRAGLMEVSGGVGGL